jgi:hypothetical protein
MAKRKDVPNLPKPLRTLFMVAVVLAPIYWLIMTDSGRQTTDLMLLDLFGKDTIRLQISNLTSQASEDMFHEQFPDVTFVCADQATEYGNRICQSSVGSFNDLPSQHLLLFFSNNRLQAFKLTYQLSYHDVAVRRMENDIVDAGQALDPDAEILQWRTSGGLMVMQRARPQSHQDAAIMWIAAERL